MHSLSGLIHADHRTPYPRLQHDPAGRSGADEKHRRGGEGYALACFNVLAHNRDDHAKNFSFLLNDRNAWVFAPAYDLTFSDGPAGEQSTMVMGEGRNPTVGRRGELLTTLAPRLNIFQKSLCEPAELSSVLQGILCDDPNVSR
jgi:hypothetical protein